MRKWRFEFPSNHVVVVEAMTKSEARAVVKKQVTPLISKYTEITEVRS